MTATARQRPNLLFVFADQWRRHAVGCMHADPVLTPHIDRFASEGLLFENAFACTPICTPNRAAMLTGKYPFAVNMMRNWLRLPVHEETIATVARRHGYATGYIGKWHLDEWDGDERFGNPRDVLTPAGPRRMGFEYWYAHGCDHRHFAWRYLTTDNRTVAGNGWQLDHETDVTIDYLRNTNGQRDPQAPFCLYLSWSPPHDLADYAGAGVPENCGAGVPPATNCGADVPPATNCGAGVPPASRPRYQPGAGRQYAAPERFEALYRRPDLPVRINAQRDMYLKHAPGYFGAVSSLDENFGRLLAALDDCGLSDNTIVVLTADHGEMLGSHRCMIKDIWYEESIGIPFLLRWPGKIKAGGRESVIVNTPDMVPSLLGLMGCAIPSGRHGEDLSAVILEQTEPRSRRAFLAFDGAEPYGLARWNVFGNEGVNRAWRGVRTDRYLYVALAREKYGNATRFKQPLPADVNELLFDLENDPYQINPIYPGQTAFNGLDIGQDYDPVFTELHSAVKSWLTELGDPFLERSWK